MSEKQSFEVSGDGPLLGEAIGRDLAGFKLVWVYDLRLINEGNVFLPACFKETDKPILVSDETLLERVRSVLPDFPSEIQQMLCLLHVESGTAWCVWNRNARQFTQTLSITSQERLDLLLDGESESFAWRTHFEEFLVSHGGLAPPDGVM